MKRATVEPVSAEVQPIHWRDAEQILGDLKVVGCDLLPNKFGWVLKRLLDGKRFLVQGPPCTVVFAPAYQDPTKFKLNPREPDPNRKRDKWNCTLRTKDADFAKLCNGPLKQIALKQMYEVRASWGGNKYGSPAELTAILNEVVNEDERTGEMEFSVDLTADVGATHPSLILRDYETEEQLPQETMLGQHSTIVPILDWSDVFVGKTAKSKQWSKMPTAFVRELVGDVRVDARSIKLAKRND